MEICADIHAHSTQTGLSQSGGLNLLSATALTTSLPCQPTWCYNNTIQGSSYQTQKQS